MTRGTDSERQLINQVLSSIAEQRALYERISDTDFQNASFVKRRFAAMAAGLAVMQEKIGMLTDLLWGSEENPVPTALRHARRARSNQLQAVQLQLGGIVRTIVIEPTGEDDPIGEARMWRKLVERFGDNA